MLQKLCNRYTPLQKLQTAIVVFYKNPLQICNAITDCLLVIYVFFQTSVTMLQKNVTLEATEIFTKIVLCPIVKIDQIVI